MRELRRAIVRPPGSTFAKALTSVELGVPDLGKAVRQHEAYCAAIRSVGIDVIQLAAEDDYPDATFVEDTAVLTRVSAMLTRSAAPTRSGEGDCIRGELRAHFAEVDEMKAPATLDGGDVCEAGGHVLIGVSARTNEEGARQLSAFLLREGYTAETIDIRGIPELLHLKSGLSYLGEGRFLATEAIASSAALSRYETIVVDEEDSYAANCVRFGNSLILPAGFVRVEKALEARGFHVVPVDTSEFRKVDGGPSCLSLRF